MESNIAVTNKHTAKLHHVGSLYILCIPVVKRSMTVYSMCIHLYTPTRTCTCARTHIHTHIWPY